MKMSESIITSVQNRVRLIKLNRPQKRNAMNPEVYKTLTKILNDDAENDQVIVTIITGVGDYYSSGNDIAAAMADFADKPPTERRCGNVHALVKAFIDYPKLLISVVNGPAIGIAVTSAALCDIVYASNKATFSVPFINLGLCCEAASSYTLPWILGRSKASEMLFLNHKLTAEEAYNFGFVAKVIPHEKLDQLINQLTQLGDLPLQSVKINKKLIMRNFRKILCECNDVEIDQLEQCLDSEDCANAALKFMSRKSKL